MACQNKGVRLTCYIRAREECEQTHASHRAKKGNSAETKYCDDGELERPTHLQLAGHEDRQDCQPEVAHGVKGCGVSIVCLRGAGSPTSCDIADVKCDMVRLAIRVPVNRDIPECINFGSALRVKLDQSEDDARDLDHIDDVERDLLCLGLGRKYAEEIYREREATKHRRKEVEDRKDVFVKNGMHNMMVV